MQSAFKKDDYLKGEWYWAHRVKNEIIRPREPHYKRPTDFNVIKQNLARAFEVLKYLQNFIEHLKIESTDEFRKKYIELRHTLFDIFSNLKKICEDLYTKSISLQLPEHYFRFY